MKYWRIQDRVWIPVTYIQDMFIERHQIYMKIVTLE